MLQSSQEGEGEGERIAGRATCRNGREQGARIVIVSELYSSAL